MLNIYCAGGASTNIGVRFVQYIDKKAVGFHMLRPIFIDTSRSNLDSSIPESHVYLAHNVDGSGKKRSTNYDLLNESCQEILHRFKPAEINLVVHSTSGGTGSTIGPLLVNELLARKENVYVLLIASTGTKIEIDNTAKTLKGYENISKKRNMPVLAFYRENNTTDMTREVVNKHIEVCITTLALMYSGENKELDSADMRHFLNYHEVTSYTPRLTRLEVYNNNNVLNIPRGQSIISVATLADEDTIGSAELPVEYQTIGFINEEAKKSINMDLPLHVVTINGSFNVLIEYLEKKISEFEDKRRISVEKPIVTDKDIATEEGLIL